MTNIIVRITTILFVATQLSACTRGHLSYIDNNGKIRTGCETEYSWSPSVDKHAVNYKLHYCAQKALEKGYQVLDKDILTLSPVIPVHPEGENWTYEMATEFYRANRLTDQEYGYLVAWIDLQ